ncbi:MAG: DUF2207 domain-containing protein [Clostridiales bacterium]|nr:DUF2207 domain-containing protein [Clostridiales bacterium]
MLSQKKLTVVFGILFATAVLFFIGITVFASLYGEEVTTQTIDSAMTINEMRVDVDWHKDRSCKITQNLTVEFNYERHGIYVDIPVNSGERVRNLTASVKDSHGFDVNYKVGHESGNRIVRITVGDANRYLGVGEQLYCTVEYDYLTPEHPEDKNALDLNVVGTGWSCFILNAVVTVNFPTAIQDSAVSVWVSGQERDVSLTNGGKTVTLETGRLMPFHGVRVKAIMPSGLLTSSGFEGIVTIVIGVVLVVASILLMVFLGKDKPLTPVVGFYPPLTDGKSGRKRHMLPVQLGKIIDGTCSSSDVTSLIFYWASEGYLSIQDVDGETYLTKLKEIDPVTEYERTLFVELFKRAKRNKKTGEVRVSISSLSGSFANKINAVKSAVNKEYRGGFFRSGFTALSVGMAVAAALFAVLGSMLCTLRISSGFFNLIGVITVIPVVLASVLGSMLVRTYFKLGDIMRKAFLALYLMAVVLVSVAVMLAVPTDAMAWTEKIIFAVCIGATAAIAPFLTRRSDKYTEQLNEIIGFRNFIRDVEKSQLEMMLKDDPQYYYNILPYANVLGVSKIWQDKFAGLSIEPPTYYSGGNVSVFDIYVISRLSSSIGSSLTYTPPKVSSGSFSGGGFSGGGHSGGGSFGGFGGGGGGSW